jgi:hypothetical protein
LPRVESKVRARLGAVEFEAIQRCLEGHTTRAALQSPMSHRALSSGRARAFRKLGVGGRLELISHLVQAAYGARSRAETVSRGHVPGPFRRKILSRPDECPHCASNTGPFRELQSAWPCRACARTFTTPEVAAVDA